METKKAEAVSRATAEALHPRHSLTSARLDAMELCVEQKARKPSICPSTTPSASFLGNKNSLSILNKYRGLSEGLPLFLFQSRVVINFNPWLEDYESKSPTPAAGNRGTQASLA